MKELTQDLVKELFKYKDGFLYWKNINQYCHNRKNGDKVGNIESIGYYVTSINNKKYKLHRLIFLYHHGYLPEFIDHIDNNKINNKIENLREATRLQNNRNSLKHKTRNGKPTSSKYKGVHWDKRSQRWISRIVINKKSKYLGSSESEIKAAEIYNESAIKYFKEYAYLNKIGDNK